MRIGYLDCFSGISGDMMLGALVDAGVPIDVLNEAAESLRLGAKLEARKVLRGGIGGTKVDLRIARDSNGKNEKTPHRHLSSILGIIHAAPLAASVQARAARAFELLGAAEAEIHDLPVEKVHFHELGAVDTIVDLVCSARGAEWLGVEKWFASNLNVGNGTVECQHGRLPVPAPATLKLLQDAPVYSSGAEMERITPTGAALLRMLEVEYKPLPPARIERTGYGAGSREMAGEANLLRLLTAKVEDTVQENGPRQIAVLETAVDDMNPQLVGYLAEYLLKAGALDVYRTPLQMKKGRTGILLTILAKPGDLGVMRDLLFRESSTLGVRWRMEERYELAREFREVQTPWGAVPVKLARDAEGHVLNAAPEYDVCRELAEKYSIPLKQIMQCALEAWAAGKGAK